MVGMPIKKTRTAIPLTWMFCVELAEAQSHPDRMSHMLSSWGIWFSGEWGTHLDSHKPPGPCWVSAEGMSTRSSSTPLGVSYPNTLPCHAVLELRFSSNLHLWLTAHFWNNGLRHTDGKLLLAQNPVRNKWECKMRLAETSKVWEIVRTKSSLKRHAY